MEAPCGYICYEQPEAAIKARAAAQFLEDCGLTLKHFIASIEVITGKQQSLLTTFPVFIAWVKNTFSEVMDL